MKILNLQQYGKLIFKNHGVLLEFQPFKFLNWNSIDKTSTELEFKNCRAAGEFARGLPCRDWDKRRTPSERDVLLGRVQSAP